MPIGKDIRPTRYRDMRRVRRSPRASGHGASDMDRLVYDQYCEDHCAEKFTNYQNPQCKWQGDIIGGEPMCVMKSHQGLKKGGIRFGASLRANPFGRASRRTGPPHSTRDAWEDCTNFYNPGTETDAFDKCVRGTCKHDCTVQYGSKYAAEICTPGCIEINQAAPAQSQPGRGRESEMKIFSDGVRRFVVESEKVFPSFRRPTRRGRNRRGQEVWEIYPDHTGQAREYACPPGHYLFCKEDPVTKTSWCECRPQGPQDRVASGSATGGTFDQQGEAFPLDGLICPKGSKKVALGFYDHQGKQLATCVEEAQSASTAKPLDGLICPKGTKKVALGFYNHQGKQLATCVAELEVTPTGRRRFRVRR